MTLELETIALLIISNVCNVAPHVRHYKFLYLDLLASRCSARDRPVAHYCRWSGSRCFFGATTCDPRASNAPPGLGEKGPRWNARCSYVVCYVVFWISCLVLSVIRIFVYCMPLLRASPIFLAARWRAIARAITAKSTLFSSIPGHFPAPFISPRNDLRCFSLSLSLSLSFGRTSLARGNAIRNRR
jgi:hypothetical protein